MLSDDRAKIGITVKVTEVPIQEWFATLGYAKHGLSYMWYFDTTGDPTGSRPSCCPMGQPAYYSNATVTT